MSEILGLVISFLPLFAIVWVANIAEARREKEEPYTGMAMIAYIFLAALYVGGFFLGILVQIFAFAGSRDPSLIAGAMEQFPLDSMELLAVGLWLPSLLGILLLLPPIRRLLAKYIPIDSESPVHAVSLSLSMLALVNLMVTLGFGLGNFADMLAEQEGGGETTISALWIQQILTALWAMIGVGWLTRRSWSQMLDRLALVLPTVKQWLIGIGAGVGMVAVVIAISALAESLGLSPDTDVDRLSEQLLGSLFTTPLGILTIGVAAGLGEETLFRGAVLSRFGLILTSVLFALIHSQYGITLSTLIVFILGIVLGLLRIRYNTSTAMITHAVYNMTLGILAYMGTNLDF